MGPDFTERMHSGFFFKYSSLLIFISQIWDSCRTKMVFCMNDFILTELKQLNV